MVEMRSGPAVDNFVRTVAVTRREEWRREGKRVGFTSGSFDLLHFGHVSYLQAAKAQVDRLIVGVNSDVSVRAYKSPQRPYIRESERAGLVAALACVDAVFLFDELNNNTNVELLKPDIYFKAGDYSKQELSSAPLVEGYGGRVEIIPLVEGLSSTAVANRVVEVELGVRSASLELAPPSPRPAAFLDRDGTIIEHIDYLHEAERVTFLPGALQALRLLRESGWLTILVTNQPGIGLGYFTKDDFFAVMRRMFFEISRAGGAIDKIYFCPHSASESCACRKPGTALLERAKSDLNVDWEKSFFVGDMTSDVECARRFGLRSALVQTGRGGHDDLHTVKADVSVAGLLEAVEWGLDS